MENNILVLSRSFEGIEAFDKFDKIIVEKEEEYCCNCLWFNDKVIFPKGFPVTKERLVKKGLDLKVIEMTEFEKIDGGLTCLSLRW